MSTANFRDRRLFLKLTVFSVDPLFPYPLGLAGEARSPEHFKALLAEALARETDIVRLRYLPFDLFQDEGSQNVPDGSRLIRHRSSCVSLAGGWSVDHLSRRVRKTQSRRERALEQMGELRLAVVRKPAERLDACRCILAWKRVWLRKRFKLAFGFRDTVFQHGLIERFGRGDPGTYYIFALLLEGKPIAYEFCIRSGSRLLSLLASFDETFARYGPGRLLTSMILQNGGDLNADIYDMLPPETDFKKSIADRTEDYCELIVPRTGIGKVFVWLAGKIGRL